MPGAEVLLVWLVCCWLCCHQLSMLRPWWPTQTNFSRKLASLTIVWHLHLFWLSASLGFLNLGFVVPHSMVSQLTTCPPRMCVANVIVSVPWWQESNNERSHRFASIRWIVYPLRHGQLSGKLHQCNQCEVVSTKLVDSMGRRTLLLSGGFVQTIAMASCTTKRLQIKFFPRVTRAQIYLEQYPVYLKFSWNAKTIKEQSTIRGSLRSCEFPVHFFQLWGFDGLCCPYSVPRPWLCSDLTVSAVSSHWISPSLRCSFNCFQKVTTWFWHVLA